MMYTTWNAAEVGFAGSGGEESAVNIANDADVVACSGILDLVLVHLADHIFITAELGKSSSGPAFNSAAARILPSTMANISDDNCTSHLNDIQFRARRFWDTYSTLTQWPWCSFDGGEVGGKFTEIAHPS
jgi:hypothetical protein